MFCLQPLAEPSITSMIIDYAKSFFPSIAAILVGWAAIRVSKQQAQTAKFQADIAKAKLNHDLFEKRYELFETTWEFLSNPQINYMVSRPKFTNLIPKASFLFGSDIETYMKEVSTNAFTWHALILKHNTGISTAEDIAKMSKLEAWFVTEASTGVKTIFGKYMNFSDWKS